MGFAIVPQERVEDSTAKNSARSTNMAKPMEISNMDIGDGEQHQPKPTKLVCLTAEVGYGRCMDTTGLCIIVECR